MFRSGPDADCANVSIGGSFFLTVFPFAVVLSILSVLIFRDEEAVFCENAYRLLLA